MLSKVCSSRVKLSSQHFVVKVKAPGVSDLHIRDLQVWDISGFVSANIIDVYTVVLDTTPYTVVTVSDSTYAAGQYHSGFYDHAFSLLDKEVSFKVSGPLAAFANVTIPETLVSVESSDEWKVKVDGVFVTRTVTYNGTHYFVYFTYDLGTHAMHACMRCACA